jgi:hypothetical protein
VSGDNDEIMAIGVIGTATFTQSATPVRAQDTIGTQGQGKKKKMEKAPKHQHDGQNG